MATISFDVPNAVLPRLADAFAATYGYQATLPDGTANPETKNQFAQRMVRQYARNVLAAYEATLAAETARASADTKAKTDFA